MTVCDYLWSIVKKIHINWIIRFMAPYNFQVAPITNNKGQKRIFILKVRGGYTLYTFPLCENVLYHAIP